MGKAPGSVAAIALAFLLLAPTFLILESQSAKGVPPGPPWWNENWRYRHRFTVGPAGYELLNHPVELELDFGKLIRDAGGLAEPFLPASLRLVEYNGSGNSAVPLKQADGGWLVPLRFEPAPGFDPLKNAVGTITFAMNGTVPQGSERNYQLYFDTRGSFEVPAYGLAPLDALYWMGRGQLFYGFNPGVEQNSIYPEVLHVTGLYNTTNVSVYNITGGAHTLIDTRMVDLGELLSFKLAHGIFFSVESNRPVVASLDNGGEQSAAAYYPCRDGGLAGKDFWYYSYRTDPSGTMVYAFEDSTVVIYDKGKEVSRFQLSRGPSILRIQPKGDRVLHVTSTGKIMLGPIAINGFTGVPSDDGAPYGKSFSPGIKYWREDQPTYNSVLVLAHGKAAVKIAFTISNRLSVTKELEAGQYFYYGFDQDNNSLYEILDVESTGDISVIAGGNERSRELMGMGDDITFVGGLRAREFNMYAIHNEPPPKQDQQYPDGAPAGVVFSFFDNNRVYIDGKVQTLGKGGYISLEEGQHIVKADKPVSVLTLGRGMDGSPNHRWNDWGTYLAGRLFSPPVRSIGTELFDERYGVELLPGPGELQAGAGLIIHRTDPGKASTFSIRVHNTGNRDDTYTMTKTGLPAGWNLTATVPDALALGAGLYHDISLGISPPADAKADDWAEVHITAVSWSNATVQASIILRLVVNATYFLELRCDVMERYVDPGQSAVFGMELRNGGNAPDTVSLSAFLESGEPWSAFLSCSTFSLVSGGTTALNLTVLCPPEALALKKTVIRVTGASAGNGTMTGSVLTITIANRTRGFEFGMEPREKVAGPGEQCDFEGSISNNGNGEETYTLQFESGPADWVLTLSRSSLALEPHGKGGLHLTALLPERVGPGCYTIRVQAQDSLNNTKVVIVVVKVLQVYAIRLSCGEMAHAGLAGGTFRLTCTVSNLGNGNDEVRLSVNDSKWNGRFEPSTVALGPGASTQVNLTLTAPVNAHAGPYYIDLTARSGGNPNVTSSARACIQITTIKETTSRGDLLCLSVVLVTLACFGVYLAASERRRRLRLRIRR